MYYSTPHILFVCTYSLLLNTVRKTTEKKAGQKKMALKVSVSSFFSPTHYALQSECSKAFHKQKRIS